MGANAITATSPGMNPTIHVWRPAAGIDSLLSCARIAVVVLACGTSTCVSIRCSMSGRVDAGFGSVLEQGFELGALGWIDGAQASLPRLLEGPAKVFFPAHLSVGFGEVVEADAVLSGFYRIVT